MSYFKYTDLNNQQHHEFFAFEGLLNASDAIKYVMANDKKYRGPEYWADNSSLKKLNPFHWMKSEKWDNCLPTIVGEKSIVNFDSPQGSSDTDCTHMRHTAFVHEFYNANPELSGLNYANILIAGGAVSASLLRTKANDVDIFIYGLSQEDTMRKARQVCDHLQGQICTDECVVDEKTGECSNKNKCKHTLKKFKIARTPHTITVCNKYQIICVRAYKSKHQILRGFDLGSCAVGFDGVDVLFTELGLFAYVYGYNIVDTTRRSTTYEKRLIKYLGRGFGIILPDLELEEIQDRNKSSNIEINRNFKFDVESVDGNKIVAKFPDYSTLHEEMDYQAFTYDVYHATRHNLRLLYKRGDASGLYYTGQCVDDIFDSKIVKESISKEVIKKIVDDMIVPNVHWHFIRTFLLERYFSEAVVLNLFTNRKNKTVMKSIIDDLCDKLYRKLVRFIPNDLSKMEWITVNPGSQKQLCGSFNPIMEDPEEWYGIHYKKALRTKNPARFYEDVEPADEVVESKDKVVKPKDKVCANTHEENIRMQLEKLTMEINKLHMALEKHQDK